MTPLDVLIPVSIALLIWWSATGILLYLNRLPMSTYPLSMLGGTFLLGIAFACLELSLESATPSAAYLGFLAAVLLWGWLEMGYLMGYLAGPVRTSCPPGLKGVKRFVRAVAVGLYHELAIVACGVMLIVLSSAAENTVAAWTFGTLWAMRWSAKLNLYLGVSNLDTELVPERLRYLVSYMGKQPMNLLFPLSVSAGSLAVLYHVNGLWQAADPGAAVGAALLATLTMLGVLEHWFLVLPLKDSRLWRWTFGSREPVAEAAEA